MKRIPLAALAVTALLTTKAFGHGEDKKGPHGGFIRMPGAFHTEVVAKKNALEVFFLDINWKEPVVKNSSAAVKIIRNGKEKDLQCRAQTDRFVCDLPKGEKLSSGQLSITAKRGELPSGTAVYDLPLSLTKSNSQEHEGHH